MTPAKHDAKIPPKPGKDVVYLDIDDDITTVVDKVEASKDKIVALVLPKRFATLQSIVNMRLLKRSADSASKNIVLITSEAALMPLAGAAGLHVAKNLQSKPEIPPSPVNAPGQALAAKADAPADPDAEVDADDAKLDYHRSIGVLAAAEMLDEPETIPLEDDAEEDVKEAAGKPKKAPKDKKLKVPNFDRFRTGLILGIAGIVALIVFLILAIFVLPKATVTLATEATPVSAVFEVDTSPKATAYDEKQAVIPAELKSSALTSSQKVQATGEQNNGKKASGSVDMKVRQCSFGPPPSDVPAGTGLSTNGLFYITQSAANFGAPSWDGSCYNFESGGVQIIAQSAGSKYNVSGATFSVTGRSDVSATGSASGGSDDIKTVVSQADINGASNKITDNDKNKFVDDFKKQLDQDGYYLIDATFKAKDPVVTSSPAVGQEADQADVSVKITYSILVVPKEELKKAVTSQLEKQIDKSKQKLGNEDVLSKTTINVQSQKSSTVATLSISANSAAVSIIDTEAIKQQASGKKAGDIKQQFSELPGVKSVDVKMSPFWVSKAPKAAKITVVQQQVETKPDSGS
ncbi:MAG TPA: hypothetical protein VFW52_00545 [Candidatus Saccharimonadales bacterium]|nr:hypothetical protein [Candidatus Saccharimonadales bacterium]